MRRVFLGQVIGQSGEPVFKDNEQVVVKEPLERAVKTHFVPRYGHFERAKYKTVERVSSSKINHTLL